ncbi:ShlB/FhaC/HecB family hemolysin secretion/activation protein [Campylobacter sp. 9BO]|uniref:ShlB/FhaC/HecB family hemolysin secretion/activation protein n=1 Tax=Campylobacter sp. 9BO TaxID=3424759 RepID=UPI003D333C02
MFKKLSLLLFVILSVYADELNILQREFKNEQDRIKELQDNTPKSNISLQSSPSDTQSKIIQGEIPCFEIDTITLDDKGNSKFQTYLEEALNKVGFKIGSCLGQTSVAAIILAINNEIILNGYITSLVSIKPLNLKSRKIDLDLNLGAIDKISINNEDTQRHRAMLFTGFGELTHNKTLNIRDIEQALDNISNATIGDVGISLTPSNTSNSTNVVITRDARELPVSLNISIDNHGSKETGRYQGSFGISGVNLMGFNEIYTLSLGRAILNNEKTRLNDESKKGGSHNHYIHFTIPFGYFNLNYTNSRYSYSQIIAGANGLYKYSGTSRNQMLGLSYLFYRDQSLKGTAFVNFFKRNSKNYIEEFELKNQRRVSAGYEIGLRSHLSLSGSQLSTAITYKRGTGMLRALPAPEQSIGEGTSRMKIWIFDLGYKKQLNQNLSYEANLHAQYNKSKLTLQDRLSIGGIYSVRGFDGQMSLVGQKGVYIRNNLKYNYVNNHIIYLALDGGAVYSSTSGYTGSNKLAGYGVGLKGSLKLLSQTISYDLLAQAPIYKPEHFKTDRVNLSFRVGVGW